MVTTKTMLTALLTMTINIINIIMTINVMSEPRKKCTIEISSYKNFVLGSDELSTVACEKILATKKKRKNKNQIGQDSDVTRLVHFRRQRQYVCPCVFTRMHGHVHGHVRARARACVCLFVCEFECVPACAFVYTCVCVCLCVCICVCMRVHLMETKLDTCQSSRGLLGRSKNVKTNRNSEILRIERWTDQWTNLARYSVACL